MSLEDIAAHHGVDKLYAHSYIPAYQELFEPIRESATSVLEIGIGYPELMKDFSASWYKPGASLRLWRDYFPNALIYGCDIRADVMFREGRITTCICDQSSIDDLRYRFAGLEFDIIIDDGSHQAEHQLISWSVLQHNLKPGGIYVIEDVQQPERIAEVTGGTILRFNKRPDDTLVVWRKP